MRVAIIAVTFALGFGMGQRVPPAHAEPPAGIDPLVTEVTQELAPSFAAAGMPAFQPDPQRLLTRLPSPEAIANMDSLARAWQGQLAALRQPGANAETRRHLAQMRRELALRQRYIELARATVNDCTDDGVPDKPLAEVPCGSWWSDFIADVSASRDVTLARDTAR